MKDKKKKRKGKSKKPGEKTFSPEKQKEVIVRVQSLAEPLCDSEGMELVHTEYQRETGGGTLRLYIDKPGGIRLDDCVNISRQLRDLMDVYFDEDFLYNLEVSSPGLNRPLGKKDDFERFKGKTVVIKTWQPLDGKKKFKGVLMGLQEDTVKLLIGEKTMMICFDSISRSHLVNNNGEDKCL